MSHLNTHPNNKNKHPGIVDLSPQRRTPIQKKADNTKAMEEKQAREGTHKAGVRQLANVEQCAMQKLNVTIGLVTSTQDALSRAPRAEEVEEVTAMLGQLQVKEEDLAPHKGNWAYCKSSPSPDDLPSPTQDIPPEEWDDILNPQEAAEEPEGEPLSSVTNQ